MSLLRSSSRFQSAWFGFTLAGLFFYPLASALSSGNIYYLQWQPEHAAEAAIAFAGLTLVGGLAFRLASPFEGIPGAAAVLLLAVMPLASFAVALVLQLGLRSALIPLWEWRAARYGVPAVAALVALALLVRRPALVRKGMHVTLAALSPVAVVVLVDLGASARYEGPRVRLDHGADGLTPTRTSANCVPVVAFIFDELSFAYLYDGRSIRAEFPAFRRFGERASHHLAVRAPGHETLVAMPGFLVGRRLDNVVIQRDGVWEVTDTGEQRRLQATGPEGLFGTARRLGFRTEMAGYYFAYCDLLAPILDACRSFSFYNASSVDERFSPSHAVQTTMILWPRQFPFGLVKNPPFAVQQRGLVEATVPFAIRPLAPGRPTFRLVHFSLPHLPFAFDERGYNPPFNPLRTSPDDAYVRQLRYVDRLFDRLVSTLARDPAARNATIVALSDHGFRFGGRDSDPLHIPFLARHAGQMSREDVVQPESGETLLQQTLVDACETPQPNRVGH